MVAGNGLQTTGYGLWIASRNDNQGQINRFKSQRIKS